MSDLCKHCGGDGYFACPQHGHGSKCMRCDGTGKASGVDHCAGTHKYVDNTEELFVNWKARAEKAESELAAERERCIEENNQLKKALEIVAKRLATFYPGLSDDHHERIIRAAIQEATEGGE